MFGPSEVSWVQRDRTEFRSQIQRDNKRNSAATNYWKHHAQARLGGSWAAPHAETVLSHSTGLQKPATTYSTSFNKFIHSIVVSRLSGPRMPIHHNILPMGSEQSSELSTTSTGLWWQVVPGDIHENVQDHHHQAREEFMIWAYIITSYIPN